MSSRQSPNEAQPVIQRVRIEYAKAGRMRFASHRDFQRALERAVRRSGMPVAFSGGFHPHPRISYANAAPTGAASDAEYVELGLARPVDPAAVAPLLSEALPEGFTVTRSVAAGSGSLADRLEASEWQWQMTGLEATEVGAAVDRLLSVAPVTVPRMTKSGPREIGVTDAWAAHRVSAASPAGTVACVILRVVVRHVTPSVRPEDVLTALVERADLRPPESVVFTRLAQGPLLVDPIRVGDPLAEPQ